MPFSAYILFILSLSDLNGSDSQLTIDIANSVVSSTRLVQPLPKVANVDNFS